jgi:enoyl-CoA hydratase/carnithine racemase
MAAAPFRIDQHPGVALITLTGPAWEAVGPPALTALIDLCERLRDDHSTTVVVMTGEGGRFCGDWAADADPDQAGAALAAVAALPQPVIAALGGPAHGAACELALAADIRLAAADASLQLCGARPLPLAGGITRLGRAVGRGAAAWIALTNPVITADAALAWGLVSATPAAAGLLPAALHLAGTIAARGPIAVRFTKEAVRDGADLTLAQALRFETDLTVILQTTADRAEGVAAFVAKRPPRFDGR